MVDFYSGLLYNKSYTETKELIMYFPTFIARKGPAVLWSWGNYRFTIDVDGVKNKIVMNDTDFEDALEIFNLNYGI
jgi:hypothetical protein